MGLLDQLLAGLSGVPQATGQAQQPQPAQNPLSALLNNLGAGNQTQSTGLLGAAMAMVQQNGGLTGLLDKFRQSGMAQHADSWVGNGPNMNISADQVQQALGSSSIGQIASQLGISNGQASSAMARILPELVNHLTPNGQIPDNHNELIAKALSLLRGVNA